MGREGRVYINLFVSLFYYIVTHVRSALGVTTAWAVQSMFLIADAMSNRRNFRRASQVIFCPTTLKEGKYIATIYFSVSRLNYIYAYNTISFTLVQ